MTDVGARLSALAPSEQSFFGYLFWLSRPRFWFYLAGPVIVGVVYGAQSVGELFTPVTVGLFLYFLVPANIFLYGINDIFDADIDQTNPKKAEGGREVRFDGDRAVAATVGAAAVVGIGFAPVLTFEATAALGAFYLLGAGYSAPPLRFKTTPLLDSISNGLYIMPGLGAYAAVTGSLPPVLVIAGGWLWTMGMHTFSAIPDIEPDREAGIQTTATVLGEQHTYAYCGACWLGATLLMGFVHPFFASVFGIYPLFVVGIVAAPIDVTRAYWWFPFVNLFAGTLLSLGGIWRVFYV